MARESLTMAYDTLSQGTKEEGWKLKVMFTRGSVFCPKCSLWGRLRARKNHHSIDPASACPRCGSSMKVKEGLEIKITGVE